MKLISLLSFIDLKIICILIAVAYLTLLERIIMVTKKNDYSIALKIEYPCLKRYKKSKETFDFSRTKYQPDYYINNILLDIVFETLIIMLLKLQQIQNKSILFITRIPYYIMYYILLNPLFILYFPVIIMFIFNITSVHCSDTFFDSNTNLSQNNIKIFSYLGIKNFCTKIFLNIFFPHLNDINSNFNLDMSNKINTKNPFHIFQAGPNNYEEFFEFPKQKLCHFYVYNLSNKIYIHPTNKLMFLRAIEYEQLFHRFQHSLINQKIIFDRSLNSNYNNAEIFLAFKYLNKYFYDSDIKQIYLTLDFSAKLDFITDFIERNQLFKNYTTLQQIKIKNLLIYISTLEHSPIVYLTDSMDWYTVHEMKSEYHIKFKAYLMELKKQGFSHQQIYSPEVLEENYHIFTKIYYQKILPTNRYSFSYFPSISYYTIFRDISLKTYFPVYENKFEYLWGNLYGHELLLKPKMNFEKVDYYSFMNNNQPGLGTCLLKQFPHWKHEISSVQTNIPFNKPFYLPPTEEVD